MQKSPLKALSIDIKLSTSSLLAIGRGKYVFFEFRMQTLSEFQSFISDSKAIREPNLKMAGILKIKCT